MSDTSQLFAPIAIGSVTLPNRIMISPMCQYCAVAGQPVDWHFAHLGSLAMSGAGLLCIEATGVNPEGRITPGCLGLYSDATQAALQRLVQSVRAISSIPVALQLSHAGRKASSHTPWEGGSLIAPSDGGWVPLGPSAIAQKLEEPAPHAMNEADIHHVVESFRQAATRARAIGVDVIELHMAHGYLMHQFMSLLSNQRTDRYGGSLENRMRLPLEVFKAVLEAAGPGIPVGVRLSATDWVDGGWDIEQTMEVARQLEQLGSAFLDISSGGLSPQQKIPIGPGYQVHFATQVRANVKIPVVTVGLITDPQQAEEIVASGRADIVALARGFLHDPRWPWRAAAQLGSTVVSPRQLLRCLPHGHAPVFGDVRIGQR